MTPPGLNRGNGKMSICWRFCVVAEIDCFGLVSREILTYNRQIEVVFSEVEGCFGLTKINLCQME